MPQPSTAAPPSVSNNEDAIKWVVVLMLVFVALLAMIAARRVVAPVDGLVTQLACKDHGKLIGRELMSYERSNHLAIAGRTDGSCRYGPVQGGSDNLEVSIPEIGPGGIYGATKVMGFVLQLGAASVAVRLLADPLLDRFVRQPE